MALLTKRSTHFSCLKLLPRTSPFLLHTSHVGASDAPKCYRPSGVTRGTSSIASRYENMVRMWAHSGSSLQTFKISDGAELGRILGTPESWHDISRMWGSGTSRILWESPWTWVPKFKLRTFDTLAWQIKRYSALNRVVMVRNSHFEASAVVIDAISLAEMNLF